METPNVTQTQVGAVVLAAIAAVGSVLADASTTVSVAGLVSVTVLASVWMLSDAWIRGKRADMAGAVTSAELFNASVD